MTEHLSDLGRSDACVAGEHGACNESWVAWTSSRPTNDYPCRCECHPWREVDLNRAVLAGVGDRER